MKKRLMNKKGESMIETLAAILIFTMASIALYSMVTTAAGINLQVSRNDKMVQQQMDVAERAEVPVGKGTVKMVMNARDTDITVEENIEVFRSNEADDSYYSYFAAEETEPAGGI